MTIQEAIKSGKPFKLPSDDRYMIAKTGGMLEYVPIGKRNFGGSVRWWTKEMFLSTDWEIKE